jgi:hypothetical protein
LLLKPQHYSDSTITAHTQQVVHSPSSPSLRNSSVCHFAKYLSHTHASNLFSCLVPFSSSPGDHPSFQIKCSAFCLCPMKLLSCPVSPNSTIYFKLFITSSCCASPTMSLHSSKKKIQIKNPNLATTVSRQPFATAIRSRAATATQNALLQPFPNFFAFVNRIVFSPASQNLAFGCSNFLAGNHPASTA